MEVDMASHNFLVRRDIYRKLLADEMTLGKRALSLKLHIAEPDAGGFKLVNGRRKHPIADVPID